MTDKKKQPGVEIVIDVTFMLYWLLWSVGLCIYSSILFGTLPFWYYGLMFGLGYIGARYTRKFENTRSDGDWKRRLVGVGLLAYGEDQTPRKCLRNTIPVTTTRIRPYLTLNQPKSEHAAISIAVQGSDNKGIYLFKNDYQLHEGRNTITADKNIRLDHPVVGETWTLKINVNDLRIVERRFTVRAERDDGVTIQLNADGELDPSLIPDAEPSDVAFSLDDLLGKRR